MSITPQKESPLERLKRLRAETAEKLGPQLVGEASELRSGEGSEGSKDPHQRTDKTPGVVDDIDIIEVRSSEEIGLVAASWTLKERLGKTIWQRPQNGFWYSQEMASRLLENGGGE